jgi:hypothetical protein
MKLVQKLLNKFNGLKYPQEYLCLAHESFQQPLYAYLVQNHKVIKDITKLHSFVGYCPLIFALSSSAGISPEQENIDIVFSATPLQANVFFGEKDALALLSLKKIHEQSLNGDTVVYYEGNIGKHRFISSFYQFIGQLNNRLYNRKPGNVFLEDNLYKQVQIGYAIPRKISLITVGHNNLYNHFPTDLHGQVNDEYYIISLRHEGAACRQVENAQKIVLSDMKASAFKQTYALGKNHMQPLKEASAFNFSAMHSKCWQLPLPNNALSYKELQLEDSFTHGIHKLLLFRMVGHEQLNEESGTLVHIHNVYATWRHKKGIAGNYFLR